jgi:hypothetical protein
MVSSGALLVLAAAGEGRKEEEARVYLGVSRIRGRARVYRED